jgi:hypothetical protein
VTIAANSSDYKGDRRVVRGLATEGGVSDAVAISSRQPVGGAEGAGHQRTKSSEEEEKDTGRKS